MNPCLLQMRAITFYIHTAAPIYKTKFSIDCPPQTSLTNIQNNVNEAAPLEMTFGVGE